MEEEHLLSSNMEFYTYLYRQVCTKRPIYVGKGKGRRWRKHLDYAKHLDWSSKEYDNPWLINAIRKLIDDIEILFIATNLSEAKAFALERKLIKRIGRRDIGTGPLLNLTDGGDGGSGYVFTEETKQLLSCLLSASWTSKRREIQRQLKVTLYASSEGNRVKTQIQTTLKQHYLTPAGSKLKQQISEFRQEYYKDPKHRKEQSQKKKQFYTTLIGIDNAKTIQNTLLEFNRKKRGSNCCKNCKWLDQKLNLKSKTCRERGYSELDGCSSFELP